MSYYFTVTLRNRLPEHLPYKGRRCSVTLRKDVIEHGFVSVFLMSRYKSMDRNTQRNSFLNVSLAP